MDNLEVTEDDLEVTEDVTIMETPIIG